MGALLDVGASLAADGHPPMEALVQALAALEWPPDVDFTLSMLRLWIRTAGARQPEVVVCYDDGRHGGRPLMPYVERYEIAFFAENTSPNVVRADVRGAVDALQHWINARYNQTRGRP